MKFLTTIIFLFFVINISAQTQTPVADSVDNRFDEMIKTSNNYQNYKVVRLMKLTELRKTTNDEIKALENHIADLDSNIESQDQQIENLKAELEETNSKLLKAEKSKGELSLIGLKMNKGTYQSIVIGIIVILLVFLFTFVNKFKASNKGTVKAKRDLEELKTEYDEYRQKALETQQKLGRQLIDERNKNAKNS